MGGDNLVDEVRERSMENNGALGLLPFLLSLRLVSFGRKRQRKKAGPKARFPASFLRIDTIRAAAKK